MIWRWNYEYVDTDNDEVYPVRLCPKCNAEVREKRLTIDGVEYPEYAEVDLDDFYLTDEDESEDS